MAIAPHSRETVTAACDAPGDVRILDLWPHQHAHGVRFTAEKVTASGERTLIYETYDWAEPPTLYYDSVHQNPLPDATAGVSGGYSGLLTVSAGDRIEYACEIDNTTDLTLHFANQAYTAEMCNLFGNYTVSLGSVWFCLNN